MHYCRPIQRYSYCTVEAYEFVRRLDPTGTNDDSPHGKKPKAPTALLRDEIRKQDFAKPVASRASRILGLVSRFRIAQSLPQMCHASRVSRPGLTVGFQRIFCNGLRTAQRFHIEG